MHPETSININYCYSCLKPIASTMDKFGITSAETLAFRGSHMLEAGSGRDICIAMLIAALLTIAKR